jgi:branched-chain amino acid aminotransferase
MVDQVTKPAVEARSGETLLPIPPSHYPYMWFSGRRVPWESATVHVSLVGWPSVGAVFEGIRGYRNPEQSSVSIFCLNEHIARLETSMKLQRMAPRFSAAELIAAIVELCRANGVAEDMYVQPLAFTSGYTWHTSYGQGQAPEIAITVRPMSSDLLSGRTLRAGVSSWTRISDTVMPPRIKALPNYANSRLASHEAARHGVDAAIILNERGQVAESSASCIFLVRNGVVITPALTAGILESITRACIIELARDALGLPVQERDVDRTELYVADEVFMCGTSMEVTAVREVDGYQIGSGGAGEITSRIERLFHDVARGIDGRYAHWRTPIG